MIISICNSKPTNEFEVSLYAIKLTHGVMMQTQAKWDRHRILAEVKRKHGTLTALCRQHNIAASNLSVAFSQPYEAGERIIAEAIHQPLHVLWPDRWDNNDNRLLANATPTTAPVASQKVPTPLTKPGEVLT